MADLSEVSTDELVDDYYASKSDNDVIERLGAIYRFPDRFRGNKAIMETIRTELRRRGELDKIGE